MQRRRRRQRTDIGVLGAALALVALVGLAACSGGAPDDAAAPAPTTQAVPATSAGAAGGEPPGDGAVPQLAVAFEPARRMTRGETVTVAVTVSIDEDGAFASVVTSEPGAATSIAGLGSGCRVEITLVAEPPDAFSFLPSQAQSVDLCGADAPEATRTWAVRPLLAGQPLLGASYSVDGRDANVVPFRITVEDPSVTGAAAPGRVAVGSRRGSSGTTGIVIGVVVAAVVVVAGGVVWWRRRRSGRPAPGTVEPTPGPVEPAPTDRPATAGSPQVFLSYAREDADAVGRLERLLVGAGLDAWRDVHDIAGGADWMATIAGAVGRSVALVLVLSPSCATSEFVPSEVALAVKYGIPVVPVRVGGAEELHPALELAIVRAQVVDLRGAAWPSGAAQLVQSLRAAAARRGPFSLVDPVRRPATPAGS